MIVADMPKPSAAAEILERENAEPANHDDRDDRGRHRQGPGRQLAVA